MDPDSDAYADPVLVSCRVCGRNFSREALRRHEPICAKAGKKSRKVFDSSKMRAEGTEINTVRRRTNQKEPPKKNSNWRKTHEDFVRTIRAARGVQAAIERGGPLPPPPPPTYNPDYIQCDYCGRRFSEQAAERHINFCREKNQRLPAGGRSNQSLAAQKQAARTQYQAPRPKKVTSASNGYSTTNSGRGGSVSRGGTRAAPGSGEVLRTGRTAQTYDEARQLSAKQRASMPVQSRRPGGTDSAYSSGDYADSRYGSGTRSSGAPASRGGAPASRGVARTTAPAGRTGRGGTRSGGDDFLSKFCLDCGAKYPTPSAKFCTDCGSRK